MLLVVLCHACLIGRPMDALTPYFDGVTPRDVLTVESPCPPGTEVRSHGELGATCGVEERPDDELVVEFFKNGSLAGYATSMEGVLHGAHRTWHPTGGARETTMWRAGKQHGRHLVRAWNGDPVLEESFVDGVRNGFSTSWLGKEKRDSGRYLHGLKTGRWEEWVDGRRLLGNYVHGKRNGEWQVRERAKPTEAPDYFVELTNDKPTFASEFSDSYQGLVGMVDGAWIALAVYGHYKQDRRLVAAGAIGLVASAPLIHMWKQPARDRTAVVQRSWLARPASVAGVLLLYTIGKLFAGVDCRGNDGSDDGNASSGCKQNFNKDYNWNGVMIASAISIASYDLLHAVRRKPAPLERAWPQLGVMPVVKGGGLALSGAF